MVSGHRVISLDFIHRTFCMGNPTRLHLDLRENFKAVQDSLSKEEQYRLDISQLEAYVLGNACRLYTILLLIGESHRIFKIFLDTNQLNDGIFMRRHEHELPYCQLELVRTIRHLENIETEFFNTQWTIPAVLCREFTHRFPIDHYRFPFESKPEIIGKESHGYVYRVAILKGHLERGIEPFQSVSEPTLLT